MEYRPLRILSGSELSRLTMQLSMNATKLLSANSPTVLILDSVFSCLDSNWLNRYADLLASPSCIFQSVVTTNRGDVDFRYVAWTGWLLINLEGKPPNVTATSGFA